MCPVRDYVSAGAAPAAGEMRNACGIQVHLFFSFRPASQRHGCPQPAPPSPSTAQLPLSGSSSSSAANPLWHNYVALHAKCSGGKATRKESGPPEDSARPVNAPLIRTPVCCRDRLCARGLELSTVGSFSFSTSANFWVLLRENSSRMQVKSHHEVLESLSAHTNPPRPRKGLGRGCDRGEGAEGETTQAQLEAKRIMSTGQRRRLPPSPGYWRVPSGATVT